MKTLPSQNSLAFNPPMLGCVLYLPGLPGGDSKIYDRSPYVNHGTITGATWKRLPSGLWYLYFDGTDDWVNCGTNASLDLSAPVTFKAWYCTEDGLGCVFAKDNGVFMFMLTYGEAYSIRFYTDTNNNMRTLTLDDETLDVWTQVIVTIDTSDVFRLYRNGKLVDTQSHTESIGQVASKPLVLGRRSSTYDGYYFKGGMALLEIANRLWTAFDVQNAFNREKHLFGVW